MKKTVIYLHGYGSSGQSGTVRHLRKLMPEYNVLAPDIPINPKEALPFLEGFCKDNNADLIIGTSMGAMYAMQLVDYRRICVNPALHMSALTDVLRVGTFEYFQPTADGKTHFTITEDTIQQFREMEAKMYEKLTDENRRRCWGFFGDEDIVVNFKGEFLRHFFPNVQMFHGGHRMNNTILEKVILPFATMLLEEEWTDEWGVTYSCYGRIMKSINPQLFTCEEYTIPEGVEILKGSFYWKGCTLKKIHLPSTLRKTGFNTFVGCPIEEIELPEGMKEVNDCMCERCRKLKCVKLPSTIKRINIGAFNGCEKLEEINLPDGIETIEDNAFSGCKALKHIKLPLGLDWICSECFECSGLETIEIHENIRSIESQAFWGCDSLKALIIPETVTMIGAAIVSAHEGFEGITCKAPGFHVENDALVSDDKNELLCCWTTQKDYVVPDGVKYIGDISGNDFLETVTVNQRVELSCNTVFACDKNLRRITFNGEVKGIGEHTFYGCDKLENKPTDNW